MVSEFEINGDIHANKVLRILKLNIYSMSQNILKIYRKVDSITGKLANSLESFFDPFILAIGNKLNSV